MERAELGFDFSLFARNQMLSTKGLKESIWKTGTTIAACVFDGGVVLGSDTRVTGGHTVFEKDTVKLHYISDNIWCLGAGTAADCDHVTEMVSAKLRLFTMNTGMQPRVGQAASMAVNKLFRYGGFIQAALIFAGVDFNGPQVIEVSPDGCIVRGPFQCTGSGCYAAVSVLEQRWKPGLSEEEAKELIADAIEAGITNDLGSGSNVNLCVITSKGYEYLSHYRITNERPFRIAEPANNIEVEVIKTTVTDLSLPEVHLEILDGEEAKSE